MPPNSEDLRKQVEDDLAELFRNALTRAYFTESPARVCAKAWCDRFWGTEEVSSDAP